MFPSSGGAGAVAGVPVRHDLHGVGAGGKAVYGVGSAGVDGDQHGASGTTHGICGREPAHGVAGDVARCALGDTAVQTTLTVVPSR